ncbi:hypothetical protein QBC46DRAFT_253066 [Diplogelasinospora grovesii]|uniref:Uncharacterized protein n=1 Tax=Diplogelasinospora grovesii TaxID=303347 RepID=A0AAN6NHX2_9PEZI|nr:hypothetical protein QBC46DRAFT_253066 [Diplogelasinospora grovesii]
MRRLSSGSFLPSNTVQSDMHFPVSGIVRDSLISPLSLSQNTGYFDDVSATNQSSSSQPTSAVELPVATSLSDPIRGSRVYSPLSRPARGSALSPPSNLLHPDSTPFVHVQVQQQPRSTTASFSPTRLVSPIAGLGRSQTTMASPPSVVAPAPPAAAATPSSVQAQAAVNGAATSLDPRLLSMSSPLAGHARFVSADAANAPLHVPMIRRLVQQNARIREAWEAERKYMEANRERVEEVYKEERALMEVERAEWEAERIALLEHIERLEQQIMHRTAARSTRDSGLGRSKTVVSGPAVPALRGGGVWEASPESMRSTHSSQEGNTQLERHGATALPMPSSLGPLTPVPRGPAPAPCADQTASPNKEAAGPIVDVQEIHPELDGIPIKATTFQKPTFTDGPSQNESPSESKPSSRKTSPTTSSGRPRISPRQSTAHTLQLLAAPESARLTMHAGHTPSHSLSMLPTMTSTSGVTTARSSGESTPKILQGDGAGSDAGNPLVEGISKPDLNTAHLQPVDADQERPCEDDAEPCYEPAEDRSLRGPLMVRNMPAEDEIFFRRLSDKLEEVSKHTEAALPAVLKLTNPTGEACEPAQAQAQPEAQLEASSSAIDAGSDREESSPWSGDEEKLDVPLKLRRSNNFGAPLGVFR